MTVTMTLSTETRDTHKDVERHTSSEVAPEQLSTSTSFQLEEGNLDTSESEVGGVHTWNMYTDHFGGHR